MKAIAALAAIVVAGLLTASVALAEDVTPSPTPAATATPMPPRVTPTPVATPPPGIPTFPSLDPVLHCGLGPSSTPLPDLLPPSNLDAQLITAHGIVSGVRLVWQDNSPNETCFGMERRGGGWEDWHSIWSVEPDRTESTERFFYVPGLYCYRVYAGNAEGTSAPSDETCIEVPVATVPTPSPGTCLFGYLAYSPGAEAPTNLRATFVTSIPTAQVVAGYAVALEWEDNADDDCGYEVVRRVEEEPWTYLVQAEPKANVTSHFDVPSSVGRHCYRVAVFSAYGMSDKSNEACLDVEVVPTLVYLSPTPVPSPPPVPTLVLPTAWVDAGGGGHLASSGLPSLVWWAMAGAGVSLLAIAVLAFARPARR